MKEAAFKATYVNFKPITTRKVVQITLEIPIEHGNEVIGMLGMPDPSVSQWVAVALLNDETPKEIPAVNMFATSGTAGSSPQKTLEEPKNSSSRWEDLSYTQRAGIKCADPDFWRFLGVQNEYEAIQEVYKRCDVASRREIIKGSQAGAKFDAMMDNYNERLFKIKSDENWKNLEEYYTAR